jgi:hypothetical protein
VSVGHVLVPKVCPVPIRPSVEGEEAGISCANASELIRLDTGTRKQAVNSRDTVETNALGCLVSLCVDVPKGRMAGILRVARPSIQFS